MLVISAGLNMCVLIARRREYNHVMIKYSTSYLVPGSQTQVSVEEELFMFVFSLELAGLKLGKFR